jgi:3-dehydroquinate synthetase
MKSNGDFMYALQRDKKKKGKTLFFVIPAETGAAPVSGETVTSQLLECIIEGGSR